MPYYTKQNLADARLARAIELKATKYAIALINSARSLVADDLQKMPAKHKALAVEAYENAFSEAIKCVENAAVDLVGDLPNPSDIEDAIDAQDDELHFASKADWAYENRRA